MIQQMKDAADAVGIVALITNSTDRIETQLNSLTREEDLPIMLISWDIDTTLNFNSNGFLDNPSSTIVALLVKKPEDLTKDVAEQVAEEMAALFRKFLQNLYTRLIPLQTSSVPPISGASYKLVPKHGAGKHSGVLGRFAIRTEIGNC
jgi:hypothetical protein